MIKTTSQSKFTFNFIISNSYQQIQNIRVRCHWLISVCVCLRKYPNSYPKCKHPCPKSPVDQCLCFVFVCVNIKQQIQNIRVRNHRVFVYANIVRSTVHHPAYSTLATTFFPAKESKRERRLNCQCSAVFMNLNLRFTGSLLILFTH